MGPFAVMCVWVVVTATDGGLVLDGPAEVFARGQVSTPLTEVRVAISPDGSRRLWGVIGLKDGGWEILESARTPKGWSAAKPTPFDTAANEFDPSFAPDGTGAYFVSNRDGGLGGDDLYFAPLDAKTQRWGAAVNLGANVNSPGDEWAPVVSADGERLLFASDGRGGRGKHDLFVSRRGDAGWGPAENLGAVNSADEDFDATYLHDGQTLVFSSGLFDVEGAEVALYEAPFVDGGYAARRRLGPAVNGTADGGFTNGPSIAAGEPGWLYFSANRPGGAGRMDIWRIRYRR